MSWTGRSIGPAAGYAFFLALLRALGRGPAYLFAWLVVPYYALFAAGVRRASATYLERRFGPRGPLRRAADVLRHLHAFAVSLIDTQLMAVGRGDALRDTNEGWSHITTAYAQGEGVLLLSAHVGTRAIAAQRGEEVPIRIAAMQREAEAIERLLASHRRRPEVDVIPLNDGAAAAAQIVSALRRGSCVALLADRVRGDEQAFWIPFLGKAAPFPRGPFLLAALTGVPVVFTFGAKQGARDIHFYARPPLRLQAVPREDRHARAEGLARAYVAELEAFVARWPYQWFNFYEYWPDPPPAEAAPARGGRPPQSSP